MFTLQRVCGVVAGLVVLSCMLACGSVREAAARQKTTNDLKQLALSYHKFYEVNHRGPSGPDEWVKFATDPQEKALIELTRPGGQFVFFWNVNLSDVGKTTGASKTVLGYESKVPTAGGLVALADGAVRVMTADEFNAAPKPPENKGTDKEKSKGKDKGK